MILFLHAPELWFPVSSHVRHWSSQFYIHAHVPTLSSLSVTYKYMHTLWEDYGSFSRAFCLPQSGVSEVWNSRNTASWRVNWLPDRGSIFIILQSDKDTLFGDSGIRKEDEILGGEVWQWVREGLVERNSLMESNSLVERNSLDPLFSFLELLPPPPSKMNFNYGCNAGP